MAVRVKAYLSVNDEEPEIRRFSAEGAATSFVWLQEKIQHIFPAIEGKGFKLYWQDEEDEAVVIASDDDLLVALGSQPSDVFRVFVEILDDKNDEVEMEENGEGLEQAKCENCKAHIPADAVVFMCTICPNAVCICEGCKGEGFNKEHDLMSILPGRPYCRRGAGDRGRGFGPLGRPHYRGMPPGMVGTRRGMFFQRGGRGFGSRGGMFCRRGMGGPMFEMERGQGRSFGGCIDGEGMFGGRPPHMGMARGGMCVHRGGKWGGRGGMEIGMGARGGFGGPMGHFGGIGFRRDPRGVIEHRGGFIGGGMAAGREMPHGRGPFELGCFRCGIGVDDVPMGPRFQMECM